MVQVPVALALAEAPEALRRRKIRKKLQVVGKNPNGELCMITFCDETRDENPN